jgi:spoIIIJ-associated protein
MNEKRTHLEVIASSIEEAIENGLSELGLTEEQVEIEILDQGSRGLFGLGSRQARVRLVVLSEADVHSRPSQPDLVEEEFDLEPAMEEELLEEEYEQEAPVEETAEDLQDDVLQICKVVVDELLARMKVRARVSARYMEPGDDRSKKMAWVDVRGSDLSILIGPRAETLNALQYIAGLIVSKEIGHTIPLVVDVEGFRARRIEQLRQLARRMADQALKTGRRQVLEPMPASERRIIHMELRNHPQVSTESIGEEPRRKVTIIPK